MDRVIRLPAFIAGIVLLLVCAAAALLLSLEHVVGLSLPGCGAGSPCQQAAASVWGRVPYIRWPVSYVGLAYFLALLAAWFPMRHGVPGVVRWIVRVGVLASISFTLIMFRGGYLCPYCLATHAGNVAFWMLLEWSARRLGERGSCRAGVDALDAAQPELRPPAVRWPLTTGALAFGVVTVVLAVVETHTRHAAEAVAETRFERSSAAILAAGQRAASQPSVAESQPAAGTEPVEPPPSEIATSEPTSARSSATFTGRYRLGPERAVLRFVLFMDYQCGACQDTDSELKKLLQEHDDLSLSVKQWPGDPACNPYTPNRHTGACLAARAAEAAGMLGGDDGFWKLHFWLFDHGGHFTDDELRKAVGDFGFDADEFERVMQSEETARRVHADVEEGFELALSTTPMIFVNGVEFTGWSAGNALTRLVSKVASAQVPAATAENDHPPPATDAFIRDWWTERPFRLLLTNRSWTLGPDPARVRVVVWGDYQQPNSALADRIVREFAAGRDDVQYTFHAYPLSRACNPSAEEDENPLACRAAAAADVAGELGGAKGFWTMHAWLMRNPQRLDDDDLCVAVAEMGFDAHVFMLLLDDSGVSAAVANEALIGSETAQRAGLQKTPRIFINHKPVRRWLHGQEPLLRPILDAAAGE